MVLAAIIIYMVILLGIGYWANKKIKGMTDFLWLLLPTVMYTLYLKQS
ncbi:MAG: hypothetical protein PVH61_09565 [Candidatus Aminicenantes bacterium]|jgi:Na+/proline symporter